MAKAIKRRRGTTEEHKTFVGLDGEITVDTTKNTLVLHDGAKAGGYPLAKEVAATKDTLGLVKIGKNLTISADGTLDAKSGDPIGSLKEFAHNNIDEGYLVCNGAAVGRETYPLLFAKIGTTWGAGDGSTTFNLPDYRGRFLEGGAVAGQYKEAGLPNITGGMYFHGGSGGTVFQSSSGALVAYDLSSNIYHRNDPAEGAYSHGGVNLDASRSSDVYGKSNTVQPNSATVVICIKAFETVIETEDVTTEHLANDVAVLSEKIIPELTQEHIVARLNGKPVYEYTYKFTSTTTQNAWVVGDSLEFLNIETIISLEGVISDNNGTFTPIVWYGSGEDGVALQSVRCVITSDQKINTCISNSSFLGRPTIITIRYTKTTD